MRENLAYQEDLREELINGEIVMMSPRPAYNHNRVASNIFWVFESYLRGKPVQVRERSAAVNIHVKAAFGVQPRSGDLRGFSKE